MAKAITMNQRIKLIFFPNTVFNIQEASRFLVL